MAFRRCRTESAEGEVELLLWVTGAMPSKSPLRRFTPESGLLAAAVTSALGQVVWTFSLQIE